MPRWAGTSQTDIAVERATFEPAARQPRRVQGEYMTSTSQKNPGSQEGAGASPTPTPAQEAASKSVPLGEHIELRQQNRALADELAELKARLAAANTPPAAPAVPPPDLQETVRDLQRRAKLADLSRDLGTSPEQTALVAELIEKSPGLSAPEARHLAALRKPELFAGADDGFREGIHGGSRPGVALPAPKPPERDELADRIKYIASLQGKNTRKQDELFFNLCGSIAAEDTGTQGHHLLDIPKPTA